MSDESVIAFPGVRVDILPGVARPDISQMLRDLADRADAGEIDALVIGASIVNSGCVLGVSTPENCYYTMLGVCEALKDKVRSREPRDDEAKEYDT